MEHANVTFDNKIYGARYIIRKTMLGDGKQYTQVESSIPNATPIVYSIEYSEETETFQMTDYVEVRGRRIKVMFNLDLNLNIVGFVYNDLDHGYDMINKTEYFREDTVCDTETVYHEYQKRLIARLSELLDNQENKFSDNNRKMLSLQNKNND